MDDRRHGENVATTGKVRLLQLWLTLPKERRWTEPRFQNLRADAIPVRREPGVEVRIYSGRSGELESLVRNHVPVLMMGVWLSTRDSPANIPINLPRSMASCGGSVGRRPGTSEPTGRTAPNRSPPSLPTRCRAIAASGRPALETSSIVYSPRWHERTVFFRAWGSQAWLRLKTARGTWTSRTPRLHGN